MMNTSLNQYRALMARQPLLHQQQHKRLSRRIHDEVSQQLTLLSLQLSLARTEENPPANWAHMCQQWAGLVLELGQNLRTIVNELQPRIMDDLGLGAALQWYTHSNPKGVHCTLILPRQPATLPASAANELFSICRDIVSEFLAPNGIKEATVALEQTDETVRLQLRVSETNPALGQMAYKALDALFVNERMFCVGGGMQVQEDAVKGLEISLSIPASRQAGSNAA